MTKHMGSVAIVDDEENLRETVAYALRREDYHVDLYRDGQDAWERLENALPDVAVLDILMPRMDGLEQEHRLVSDTSRLGPQREPGGNAREDESLRTSRLYRLGSSLFRFVDTIIAGPRPVVGEEFYSAERPFDGAEIELAFNGQYGAATRITPGGQRSVTLYSALPIEHDGAITGVVLVSQSTFQLLQDLYEVRLEIFRFLLAAVAVAAILSLLVSTTISRPLKRLRRQALAILDHRGHLTGRFKGSERLDEIGDLSRSLSELSSRLEERMRFIESFAADVSHEFKNPLASMRSAAEMLAEVEDPKERERFARIVEVDIARLEKLLSEVREITLLDTSTEDDELPGPVDLNAVLRGVAGRERYESVELELDLAEGEVVVAAGPDRLARVFENLIDNAAGFSKDGHVRVSSKVEGREALAVVEDNGPGIPEEHGDKVFDRFFSFRPDGTPSEHSGLGLAIVKAIPGATRRQHPHRGLDARRRRLRSHAEASVRTLEARRFLMKWGARLAQDVRAALGPLSNRAGSKRIERKRSNTPVTAIPTRRNGRSRSHTKG